MGARFVECLGGRAVRALRGAIAAAMKYADGVDDEGVDQALWLFLGAIAERHRLATGVQLVVTSLRRPPGPRQSKHSPPPGVTVTAADLRRWHLDGKDIAESFCRDLQADWGSHLGVVLEPEWLTPEQLLQRGGVSAVKPHIHVQLKRTLLPAVL